MLLIVCGWTVMLSAAPDDSKKKNPHQDSIQSFQESCRGCHSSDPLKMSQQVFNTINFERSEEQCTTCHTVPRSCDLISTEKSTRILKSQLQYLGLPLISGSIHCASCHDFHDREGRREAGDHKLNGLYPNFWYRAQQIEPHQANVFCQLCHEGEPAPSTAERKADPRIKFKGDRVAVCIQCHDGKKARADNHPVRVAPTKEKGVNVPEIFPLSNGKVTCITCHLMPCQGGKIGKNFLRGGPYEKRVDICLTCHMKERYQVVNPHIQVDEQGKIMKNKCLYCHII